MEWTNMCKTYLGDNRLGADSGSGTKSEDGSELHVVGCVGEKLVK